jgi:hypothetical protein
LTDRSDPRKAANEGAIRIGVTGHRVAALAEADEPLLRAQIRNVLSAVKSHANGARIEVVSPLAPGADQLVAEEALALGCSLVAPLPFPRDRYAADFDDASAARFWSLLDRATGIEELPGSQSSAAATTDAYAAVGKRVLAGADLLIAIWDGADGRGDGGTSAVVGWAREQGVPIAWISSRHPHEIQVIAGTGTPGIAHVIERALVR